MRGYTDSNFETQRTINVQTYNHLDCFRELPLDLPTFTGTNAGNNDKPLNATADNYITSRIDRSLIFVSKMYYDAVARSAYADVDSGEAVEDKNDDNANKPLAEQVVGTRFEIDEDPLTEGTTFYRFDESLVSDGYVAIAEGDLGSYVAPEPVEGEEAPAAPEVYIKSADGKTAKVTIVAVGEGFGYRTETMDANATPLDCAGVTFYRFDEALKSDGTWKWPPAASCSCRTAPAGEWTLPRSSTFTPTSPRRKTRTARSFRPTRAT